MPWICTRRFFFLTISRKSVSDSSRSPTARFQSNCTIWSIPSQLSFQDPTEERVLIFRAGTSFCTSPHHLGSRTVCPACTSWPLPESRNSQASSSFSSRRSPAPSSAFAPPSSSSHGRTSIHFLTWRRILSRCCRHSGGTASSRLDSHCSPGSQGTTRVGSCLSCKMMLRRQVESSPPGSTNSRQVLKGAGSSRQPTASSQVSSSRITGPGL